MAGATPVIVDATPGVYERRLCQRGDVLVGPAHPWHTRARRPASCTQQRRRVHVQPARVHASTQLQGSQLEVASLPLLNSSSLLPISPPCRGRVQAYPRQSAGGTDAALPPAHLVHPLQPHRRCLHKVRGRGQGRAARGGTGVGRRAAACGCEGTYGWRLLVAALRWAARADWAGEGSVQLHTFLACTSLPTLRHPLFATHAPLDTSSPPTCTHPCTVDTTEPPGRPPAHPATPPHPTYRPTPPTAPPPHRHLGRSWRPWQQSSPSTRACWCCLTKSTNTL